MNRIQLNPDRWATGALTIAAFLAMVATADADLLAYEPFTNAPGTAIIGSSNGFGFNGAWQTNSSTGLATNTDYALHYTDGASSTLVTAGGAGFFQGSTTSSSGIQPIRLFNFGRGTNGADGVTTWISFLAARQGPTGTLSGNLYGRGANVPHDLDSGALQKLAIGNSSGATSNTVGLIPQGSGAALVGSTVPFGGVTNFIVVRLNHRPNANDDAYLFVNPTLSGEPSTNAANAVSTNTFDFSFDRLRIFAGGQSSAAQPYAELVVDEYRIGETYADVTPIVTNPGLPVMTGPLIITNTLLMPGGIVLAGRGGPNNGTYFVLASTNPLSPVTNWPAIATNMFDASGNFVSTNPTAPGAQQQGFRLFIGSAPPPAGVGPTISTQPTNQTAIVGNNALFIAAASGTAALKYQWYFNTNTPFAGGTNSSLTITNVQTTNAGSYSVVVTNNFGAATSAVATLTVNPPSTNAPLDFSMVGFATLDGFSSNGTFQAGGTTGGNAGPIVVASNLTWLVNFAQRSNMALRILITSDIDCSSLSNHHGGFPAGYPTGEILVSSNKTIYSTNGVTISRGSFRIGKAANGKDNIIIRNLKFRDLWVFDPSGNYDTYGWDYIGLEGGSHHVWVDHCDFEQVYDGMLDVTHGSDYVTVSWNVFRTQKKCSLIGHSDSATAQAEDTGHLNVTFHHNYYVDVDERMPRMRFGNAHVFNLYCENLGGNGIQSTADAATLVENSYFHHPQSGSLPTREENGGPTGIIKVVNSTIVNLPGVNVQFRQFGETNFLFNAPFTGTNAPYAYTLDAIGNVPNIVTNWAGVGKVSL